MPSFKDTLELVLHTDASGAISELKKFSGETEKEVKNSESSLKRLASGGLKLGVGGLGVGAMLTGLGDEATAATRQLDTAISDAGQSAEEYKGKINDAIAADEQFGHTAHETENALTTLVGSYGDTGKALDRMTLVENLAAAKHIDLASAAQIVAKAHGGAGKVFKEFGIQVGLNADGTKNYEGALDELSKKVDGQASASMAGLTGWLKKTGAAVEDDVATFAQKFGPAILGVSTGLTALSGVTQGVTALTDKMKESHARAAAAAKAQAIATDGAAGSGLGLGSALASAGALALPLAAVLPLMKISLDGNAASAKETASEMQVFADALKDANGASDDAVNKAIALNITNNHVFETVKSLGISVSDMASDVRQASPDLVNLQSALRGAGDNTSSFADAIRRARGATDPFVRALIQAHDAGKLTDSQFRDLVGNTIALGGELGTARTKAQDLKSVMGGVADKTADVSEADKKAADATKALTDEIKKLNDAYRSIVDSTLSSFQAALQLSDAQIHTRDSIDKLNKAQADGKTTADELATAQNDVFQSILAEAKANEDNADAQAKANGKTLDARDAQSAVIAELLKVADTLAPGSALRQRIADYIAQLQNDIPGKVSTKVEIDADQALIDLAKVSAYVDNIKNGIADFAGPGFNVTPPGYVPTASNPLTGLPPGLDLTPPNRGPGIQQVIHFHEGAIKSIEPRQSALEMSNQLRAQQFLGVR